jgi:hypothetical protein
MEILKADKKRIAGKGRERGIRRIAITCRTKRQNLPKALFPVREKIYKLPGTFSYFANSIRSG